MSIAAQPPALPQAPLVSAILPIADGGRIQLALRSLASFFGQSYKNKEIIIVNATGQRILSPEVGRGVEVFVPQGLSVGEMRNEGITHAAGEWLAQWDDDDWSHPDRIVHQMAHRRAGHCVMLRYQTRVLRTTRESRTGVTNHPDGARGTLLWPKTSARFSAGPSWEDSLFLTTHFADRLVVVDNDGFPGPCLHLAFWHGGNVMPFAEFMGSPEALGGFDPEAHDYISTVLPRYGLQVRTVEPASGS